MDASSAASAVHRPGRGRVFDSIVEAIGADVQRLRPGDFVIMPFAHADGSCAFCREGLPTSCVHVGFFGNRGLNGAQAEALRIPFADGTLYPLDTTARNLVGDAGLLASLLTLSDVMGTGHHAARVARVTPGVTAAVIGDGAVGLCGVIAAKRLGAERIILLGRHDDRIALAREFGATDIVRERGEAGTGDAMATAIGIARPGGAIGRVGVPHYEAIPLAGPAFYSNITVGGGPAPVRTYIDELLPDILEGRIQPGRVFDQVTDLAGVPQGYRDMNERRAIKVMVRP